MLAELEATSKAGSEGRAGWASVVGGGELTCSSAALTAGREEAVWSQSQGTLAFSLLLGRRWGFGSSMLEWTAAAKVQSGFSV